MTRAATSNRTVTIIVCGGRNFVDRDYLFGMLNLTYARLRFYRLAHGGARGADQLADEWGRAHGVAVASWPAPWKEHGRRAGPLRNQTMLDLERPVAVLAFGGGRGTADMVRRAKKAGVEVMEFLR